MPQHSKAWFNLDVRIGDFLFLAYVNIEQTKVWDKH